MRNGRNSSMRRSGARAAEARAGGACSVRVVARCLEAVLFQKAVQLVVAQAEQTRRDGLLVFRMLERFLERLALELRDRGSEIDRPADCAVPSARGAVPARRFG